MGLRPLYICHFFNAGIDFTSKIDPGAVSGNVVSCFPGHTGGIFSVVFTPGDRGIPKSMYIPHEHTVNNAPPGARQVFKACSQTPQSTRPLSDRVCRGGEGGRGVTLF